MTKRVSLNMEDLEMVTGGIWNFDTLTEDEKAEYQSLYREWEEACASEVPNEALMWRIQDFVVRMDEKYGYPPSPFD